MSFLVEEYEVPFLGKVQLINATGYDESFNGKYYSKSNVLGTLCLKCNSVDELKNKTFLRIKGYVVDNIAFLKENIVNENKKKLSLELFLENMSFKEKGFQIADWLKQYQTDNELQVEFQRKKIESGGNKK